jgi:hypothetical protein
VNTVLRRSPGEDKREKYEKQKGRSPSYVPHNDIKRQEKETEYERKATDDIDCRAIQIRY